MGKITCPRSRFYGNLPRRGRPDVERCAFAGNADAAIISQDKLMHGPLQWEQIEG